MFSDFLNENLYIIISIVGALGFYGLWRLVHRKTQEQVLSEQYLMDEANERTNGAKVFTLKYNWVAADVVPIKQKRLLHSLQIKVFAILILIMLPLSVIGLVAGLNIWEPFAWASAILIGFPSVVYFVMIPLDFRLSPAWRYPYQIDFYEDKIEVSALPATSEVFRLSWESVREVMQNPNAYSLQYGSREADFFIMPKRIFESDQQRQFFEGVLKKRADR